MTPGYENGIMVHPLNTDGLIVGFYIEGGNDGKLGPYIDENFKQEVSGKYTEQEAQEKLQPVKDAIEAKGYVAGPFETKTHKEWCVDVLGSDPEEYDRQQQENLDRYTEYDDEENG